MLIEHGHDERAILDYSVEKFNRYLAAVLRREKETRVLAILDMSATIAGTFGKGVKDYVTKLQEETDG